LSLAPVIVWFRRDLRLTDQPALRAARETGRPVLAFFCLDDEAAGDRADGGAARVWLHGALASLGASLSAEGGTLHLAKGDTLAALTHLIETTGAQAVFWTRRYEPWAVAQSKTMKAALEARAIKTASFNGQLLFEPWTVETKTGDPYKVYSPFRRAVEPRLEGMALTREAGPTHWHDGPQGLSLTDLTLLPKTPDWSTGIRSAWTFDQAAALANLEAFLSGPVQTYGEDRNRPDLIGTSRLSPYLAMGQISPRQIVVRTQSAVQAGDANPKEAAKFISEVLWREFSYHLLWHFPHMATRNWREDFDAMPWADNPRDLQAWQHGQTGYPIVDAGMAELWHTGWMHNRVRMIVASFLTKHLMIDWRAGERWFWDTLVDADLANNCAGWQWTAGSGADAAPYFRVFNPISQGQKFDPNGDYVRKWLPALANLPTEYIHAPWEADAGVLSKAGVRLGTHYPKPIVQHDVGRKRALDAYQTFKLARTPA
jgi:deoxyribodipyrimidine photo-lyase